MWLTNDNTKILNNTEKNNWEVVIIDYRDLEL